MDLLPDTRARDPKGAQLDRNGVEWVHLTCASCPASGGMTTRDRLGGDFAAYICDECIKKYGAPQGLSERPTWRIPLDDWLHKVVEVQIEEHGRLLRPVEVQRELDDPNSALSRVAREKPGREAP